MILFRRLVPEGNILRGRKQPETAGTNNHAGLRVLAFRRCAPASAEVLAQFQHGPQRQEARPALELAEISTDTNCYLVQ